MPNGGSHHTDDDLQQAIIRSKLEKVHEELWETEGEYKCSWARFNWARFTQTALGRLFFQYKVLRVYLRVVAGATNYLRWKYWIARDRRALLIQQSAELEYQIDDGGYFAAQLRSQHANTAGASTSSSSTSSPRRRARDSI